MVKITIDRGEEKRVDPIIMADRGIGRRINLGDRVEARLPRMPRLERGVRMEKRMMVARVAVVAVEAVKVRMVARLAKMIQTMEVQVVDRLNVMYKFVDMQGTLLNVFTIFYRVA